MAKKLIDAEKQIRHKALFMWLAALDCIKAVPDKRNIMGEFVPMLDTAIKKGYVRKIGDGLFEITPEFEALIDERHAASRYSERRPDPAPNR
jgi:hypothetical protein